MAIKFDMVFEQTVLKTGWIETWYLDGSDLDIAIASGQRIATNRAALIASGVTITFVRCTQNVPFLVSTPPRRQRLMLLKDVNLPGSLGGPSSEQADVSWNAMKVRFESSTRGNFRVQNMRGIPDTLWQGTPVVNLRARMQDPLDRYVNRLISEGARIKHRVANTTTVTFLSLQRAIIEGLTRRATGRPLYLSRGRRPKRPTLSP